MTNLKERRKPIKVFPGYFINEEGVVYSKRFKRPLKQQVNEYGYHQVPLVDCYGNKKTCVVHRLVAETFIWNGENKPFVNHKDGQKHNNKLENLEWCTAQENTEHAIKYGLTNFKYNTGTKNKGSVLNEKSVLKIRQLNKNGVTQIELAKRFGVSQSLISQIMRNELWQHVPQF